MRPSWSPSHRTPTTSPSRRGLTPAQARLPPRLTPGAGTNERRPPATGGIPFPPVVGAPGVERHGHPFPTGGRSPGGAPTAPWSHSEGLRGPRWGNTPVSPPGPSGGLYGGLRTSNRCSPLEHFARYGLHWGLQWGAYPTFPLRRPHSHSDGLQPVYGVTPPPGCWQARREAVCGSNRGPRGQNRTGVPRWGRLSRTGVRCCTGVEVLHSQETRTGVRSSNVCSIPGSTPAHARACAPVRLCVCMYVIKRL